MLRYALFLLPLLLLVLACEEDTPTPSDAGFLIGFGPTEGTVSTLGDTLAVPVLWAGRTTGPRELQFAVTGDGAGPDDLRLLTPSPLPVPAGATEDTILLAVAPGFDSTRAERGGLIALEPADWYRLSERDTFTFGFGVPHTAAVEIWAPEDPFPQLWGYTSFGAEPVPDGDGRDAGFHFVFAHASLREPNVIGFFNEQPGNSTNAFDLHRIYADFGVSSGSANIRIPSLFRLLPAAEGATSGTVEVIDQEITITRRASSGLPPFTVGISGGGTYDEDTGVISVDVFFDETALGGEPAVLRRYKYEANRR